MHYLFLVQLIGGFFNHKSTYMYKDCFIFFSKQKYIFINVLFIKLRQFHSLIFESELDFRLEISYSFLIFVFSTLGKSSTY